MHEYKGYWSFAPLDEMTTHTVKANTEDEAVELLALWALKHQSMVDEPYDFDVKQLS